jgi:signal transduction histidine kinase
MQDEAMRLGRMINGMVELAVMNENPKSREKSDLTVMLNKCVENERLRAEQRHIKLRMDIAPGLPFVYAEPEQLERVPINLLSNAIHCTHGGEIVIEANTNNGYIAVRVRDTGEGIPPELMPNIFERGVSGKGSKGYGLSICKTIVEAHGGEIEIESEPAGDGRPGMGTIVTFTIPVYGGQADTATRPVGEANEKDVRGENT